MCIIKYRMPHMQARMCHNLADKMKGLDHLHILLLLNMHTQWLSQDYYNYPV